MTINAQDIVTACIVLAAFGYVLRYFVRRVRRRGADGCGCCAKQKGSSSEKPLIELEDKR